MAKRRMFSNDIIDTDKFLNMPFAAQALYFHFGLQADDDGFLSSPNKTMRAVGADDEDFRQLVDNGYIFEFDTGVVVITDWKIHNWIQSDRYHPTLHQEELSQLDLDDAKRYLYTSCIQNGSIGKVRLGKARQGKTRQGNSCSSISQERKEEFEEIWRLYPRKQGKKNALESYDQARESGVTKDEILDGVKRYADYISRENVEAKYIKACSTFMSKECWNDEYIIKPSLGVVDDSDLLDDILS